MVVRGLSRPNRVLHSGKEPCLRDKRGNMLGTAEVRIRRSKRYKVTLWATSGFKVSNAKQYMSVT